MIVEGTVKRFECSAAGKKVIIVTWRGSMKGSWKRGGKGAGARGGRRGRKGWDAANREDRVSMREEGVPQGEGCICSIQEKSPQTHDCAGRAN